MSYRIGPYLIDPDAYEIRLDGASVPVEPQVFELLVFLIENRHRAVTRDDIIERVWKGRIVSDATLSSRIKAARRALGDDGAAQRLIRTIHGRGFRFVGEVTEADLPTDAEPRKNPPAVRQEETSPAATALGAGAGRLRRALASRLAGSPRRAIAAAAFVAVLGASFLLGDLLIRPAVQIGVGAIKAPAPGHKVFDGRWRVENTGNEHCFFKRSVIIWTITDGMLEQDGTGMGSVSVTGELSFTRGGARDPSRAVVYSGKLEGDGGSGSYFQERTECAGTISLTRLSPPSDSASAPKIRGP